MEVPIHLQYNILCTGIMYCMNLCHSKVVWKYCSGFKLIVGHLGFLGVGAHYEGIRLGCSNLLYKCVFGWVSVAAKSAMDWRSLCCVCHIWRWCPVLSSVVLAVFQMCSRCVPVCPDVIVSYQHFLYIVYLALHVWWMWLYLRIFVFNIWYDKI